MKFADKKLDASHREELHAFFNNDQGRRALDILSEMYLNTLSFSENPMEMAFNEGFRGLLLFLIGLSTGQSQKSQQILSKVDEIFGDNENAGRSKPELE